MKGLGTSGLPTALPFQVKSDNELLKEDIYNILTTRKGERIGNPDFGTDLHKMIFQPNVEQYQDAIKLEIVKNIESQLPLVKIINLELLSDMENSKVTVVILFISLLTNTEETVIVGDIQA